MNGLIVINKPLYLTSMDVIRKIRKLTQIKKVGHAGTLDPLATGVLLVCIGKATKKITDLIKVDKTYQTTIDLSAFSETDDAQGPIHPVDVQKIPSLEQVQSVVATFIGNITQTPSKYSAIKINGQPAYKRARNDEQFTMPSRTVTIHDIQITNYQWPHLSLKITCGSGTYIRTLGKDIGTKLQTGGYLTSLERTSVAQFSIQSSYPLDSLEEITETHLTQI